MRVLLIDDSPAVRARLVALVRDAVADLEIDQARDAAEALGRADSAAPDLVILDLHLPDLGGVELLSRLKRSRPEAVVAVLTNHANEQYRRECLARGADYFFDKSLQFDCIAEVVRQHVSRSSS
jgi:DNA-binding NarL/FixJ family response regulator